MLSILILNMKGRKTMEKRKVRFIANIKEMLSDKEDRHILINAILGGLLFALVIIAVLSAIIIRGLI